jgi:neprilysin
MKIIFVFIFANILISLSSSEQACSSIPCVLSAATIIEKLNSEVDPCDDFYEYACGSFEQEVHTPDEKSTVNTISIMSDNIYEYLLTVFSDTTKHNEMEPHKVAKDFFNSCMDTSKISNLLTCFKILHKNNFSTLRQY